MSKLIKVGNAFYVKVEGSARKSTYNALQRARTICYYIFNGKKCSHCNDKFSIDDIKNFRITMDHKSGNRGNNKERNQQWMHPHCHKSYTLKGRIKQILRDRKLVQQGLKKPGKSKYVPRATPFGG